MVAIAVCILAFCATLWAGRRSLGQGFLTLLAIGYFYGILRANLMTTFSHFIFDCGVLGLYCSQSWLSKDPQQARLSGTITRWTVILMLWCILLVVLPFQPLAVSLVGLRGNIFFLPILILGSRIKDEDLVQISCGMAVLNLVALYFAWAEYFTSVQRFYPASSVTSIIYASGDVAGGHLRIPAIFSSAHAYGGSMVASLPYLIGFWDRCETLRARLLALAGITAALLGVLMSATRQNFILGSVMILVALFTRRKKPAGILVFVALIAIIGAVALSNERFQRFKSLGDTEAVADRIAGSVNRGFFEILTEYPMGNGLGGGGTSIPYFLYGQVRNPIGMENEYARILCEQGVIGLILWIGFALWFFSQVRVAFEAGPWANSRRMAWSLAAFSLSTAWIGLGLLTAIPQTPILLMGMGWTSTVQLRATAEKRKGKLAQAPRYGVGYVPVMR